MARGELATLRTELAFEQINVVVSDNDNHWRFYFGNTHIANYWPSSGKGQVAGSEESIDCGSVAQAQKLAVSAKRSLIAEIAKTLQQTASREEADPPTPHE